jgi:tripartite-type tricarboxylate transporter receptor subunit TctC
MLGATPFAIAVNAELPARNIAEFVAWARVQQPEAAFGSTGNWGSAHLCMESFSQMAGISLLHVPYKDASLATNGLISGQVQAYCAAAANANTMARTGKVRILGVTYQKPTRLMRGIDPVSDTVAGFEFLGWYGMQVNKGTPQPIVDKINNVLARAVRNADISERLLGTGIDPVGSTPAEFANFVRNESARFAKILKEKNAKAE